MYRGCTVAVVMPAYNVEDHLLPAVSAVPAYVDYIYVVDDASDDGTAHVLAALHRPGLSCLRHATNRGVGAAIATGYAAALEHGAEIVAVMAGDGQMDPADLHRVLDPLVADQADYVKGNRFRQREVWRVMPWDRLFGNIVLSCLTRLTSGYWHIFDSQCGYTAISRRTLHALDGRLFARYGYPNDLLARLQTVGARVVEVPVRPIYDGQRSGIRLRTVIYPILFVLLRSLGRRLWHQRLRPLLRPAENRLALRHDRADRSADHLIPAPPQ